VDLVVSGPNYGRNTTAVFALSSGTLGGAMEAAVCGMRAIALSYAFFDRNHDPEIIAAASRTSVRIIENLEKSWDGNVHLYTVNVPLLKDVEGAKVLYTKMLQNAWTSGSCFTEVDVPEDEDLGPEEGEMAIRRAESDAAGGGRAEAREVINGANGHLRYKHKHFKWSPRFTDVYRSVDQAPDLINDGYAVKEGFVR
jgi:tubulin---tyrosine ligase